MDNTQKQPLEELKLEPFGMMAPPQPCAPDEDAPC